MSSKPKFCPPLPQRQLYRSIWRRNSLLNVDKGKTIFIPSLKQRSDPNRQNPISMSDLKGISLPGVKLSKNYDEELKLGLATYDKTIW